MQTTRRRIITKGAAAAAAAMALPALANAKTPAFTPEALEIARLFMILDDDAVRASMHAMLRGCVGLPRDPALYARIPACREYAKEVQS